MIGFLSLSRALFSFLNFFRCCCCWKLLNETKEDKRRGREREFCSLSLCRANKKYLENISQRAKKKKKSILSRQKIFSLLSLFSLFTGRQGFLSPPSSSSSSSAVYVKYRAAREERKQRIARGRKKSRYLVERGSVVGRFIDREKCVCARVCPPIISLGKAYLLVSSFRHNFSSFLVGKNCPSETFLFSLWFFFLSFREKGTKKRKSTQKITTARVRRASTTLST